MSAKTLEARRVGIVGGGIAGLALASGLRRLGGQVEILERAPTFGAVGAGIVLGPNAIEALRRLGLADGVLERGLELERGAITNARGERLAGTDFAGLSKTYGPTVAIHRAELHEALLSGCAGVSLRPGVGVKAIEPRTPIVRVEGTDGQEREVDLLVGADGIRSQTREQVFGEVAPVYAGYTCWRLVVSRPTGLGSVAEMWGRGKRFGLVPLEGDRVYCFAVANAAAGTPDPTDGRVDRFRALFAEFGGPVPDVLAQVMRPEQLIHNDLEDVWLESWVRGRVALVGDAAHAVTPNMGQGAAMALEDAAVLVEELSNGAPLEAALAQWQARRRARVRFVHTQSRRIGRVGHWQGAVACRLRNALVRATPDRVGSLALARLAGRPF